MARFSTLDEVFGSGDVDTCLSGSSLCAERGRGCFVRPSRTQGDEDHGHGLRSLRHQRGRSCERAVDVEQDPGRTRRNVLAVAGAEGVGGEADLVHPSEEVRLLRAGDMEGGDGARDRACMLVALVCAALGLGADVLDALENLVVAVHRPAEPVLGASPHAGAKWIRRT